MLLPDMMKTATVFRIAAWLCAALFILNGGIVLFDGVMHSERLQTQYQIGTLIVGTIFGGLSVAILGLERSLTMIYRSQAGSNIAVEDKTAYRVLEFSEGEFTAHDGARVETAKDADSWSINVNGKEYYRLADALVTGG